MDLVASHSLLTYKDVSNFEELCQFGYMYTTDQVREHPHWVTTDSPALYELVDEYAWIKPHVQNYNRLGFFTTCSQPGNYKKIPYMFPTMKDFRLLTNHMPGYKYAQRAYVSGLMHRETAERVRVELAAYPNILILVGDEQPPEDNINRYDIASIHFTPNDQPMFEFEKEQAAAGRIYFSDEASNAIPYVQAAYNITGPTFSYLQRTFPKLQGCNDDFISVSIMDKRWNCNDILWTAVTNALTHKSD